MKGALRTGATRSGSDGSQLPNCAAPKSAGHLKAWPAVASGAPREAKRRQVHMYMQGQGRRGRGRRTSQGKAKEGTVWVVWHSATQARTQRFGV